MATRLSALSCHHHSRPTHPCAYDAIQRLLEQANQSLGRLDGLPSVLTAGSAGS